MKKSILTYFSKWNVIWLILLAMLTMMSGCEKDWLDKKPIKTVVVFTTLEDYRRLIDNVTVMHAFPSLGEYGGDNFFYNDANLNVIDQTVIDQYIWASKGWTQMSLFDWSTPYKAVNAANLALEGIKKISKTGANEAEWNAIYGNSLFIRSTAFFNLVSLFSARFDPGSNNESPGIPMRLESDVNLKVGRGTVQKTYDQIISDLKMAVDLLPNISTYQVRPTKQAAYGMLARVYLFMSDFENALFYANKYLAVSSTLLDYNILPITGSVSVPAPEKNVEIIYYAQMVNNGLIQSRVDIDPILLGSYLIDDLRPSIFFRKTGVRNVWAGSYAGSIARQFTGIATDEIYLIRSECYARKNQLNESKIDLNNLLKNRFKTGKYPNIQETDQQKLLTIVLEERRKELPFRALRWLDIKRLNREPAFRITLKRTVFGVEYTLAPNDKKFSWPLPADEILYSGIAQNEY